MGVIGVIVIHTLRPASVGGIERGGEARFKHRNTIGLGQCVDGNGGVVHHTLYKSSMPNMR